jgi:hypothetical protein
LKKYLIIKVVKRGVKHLLYTPFLWVKDLIANIAFNTSEMSISKNINASLNRVQRVLKSIQARVRCNRRPMYWGWLKAMYLLPV